MSRDYGLYLDDIEVSCQHVMSYVVGLTREAFATNQMTQDAVLHNLLVIGEAVSHLPDTMRDGHPEIPWARIIGLRNMIAHGYFAIAQDTIWEIAQTDVPQLLKDVRSIRDE